MEIKEEILRSYKLQQLKILKARPKTSDTERQTYCIKKTKNEESDFRQRKKTTIWLNEETLGQQKTEEIFPVKWPKWFKVNHKIK